MDSPYDVKFVWLGKKCELLLLPQVVPDLIGFVCGEDPVTQDEIDQNALVCLFRSVVTRSTRPRDSEDGSSPYFYYCFLAESLVDWFLKHQPFELPTTRQPVDPHDAYRIISAVDSTKVYVEFVCVSTLSEMQELLTTTLPVHGTMRGGVEVERDPTVCLFRVPNNGIDGRHELICLSASFLVNYFRTRGHKTIPKFAQTDEELDLYVKEEDVDRVLLFMESTEMGRQELNRRYRVRRGGLNGGQDVANEEDDQNGDFPELEMNIEALDELLNNDADDDEGESFLSSLWNSLNEEDQSEMMEG